MALSTSYKQIIKISVPIMLASAAQQVIQLSDSVFLSHYSENDFASIGLVSVFYLMIVAIAYGFSKGGQIIIARRSGEGDKKQIQRSFYNLVYLELILAVIIFLFLRYGTDFAFGFIDNPEVKARSLLYIKMRAFGVFFSFLGVAIIAFLTGVARTRFIIWDTLVLLVVNVVLNYVFIFGKFGAPEMGIEGAALASSLAEVAAFVVFLFYFAFSKVPRQIGMIALPKFDFTRIKQILNISVPIVSQSVVSLGGWFLFFAFIENFLGLHDLAVSNLVRNIYLILIIPSWGFSSGINTIISHFIGNRKRMAVMPMTYRTALVNLLTTIIFAVPILLYPSFFLGTLFGGEEMNLFADARGSLYVLFFILCTYSVSIIYFNGMVGAGATIYGLLVQFVGSASYLVVVFILLKYGFGGLELAWGSEMIYWVIMMVMSYRYLRSKKWFRLRV